MAPERGLSQVDLGTIFDEHVRYEFEDRDLGKTLTTMTADPYVHNGARR